MEPTSPPLHKITNSYVNEQPGANLLLRRYQKKIVTKISNTQRLIQTHLSLLIFMGILIAVYLIPFLFIAREPRIMGYGVMILIMFNYNLFFQFLRKKPAIDEGRKYLHTLKHGTDRAENQEFVSNISQYLGKLYNILFFDKKKNLIPSAFLEPYEEKKYEAISKQFMTSLKNDMLLNSFIGATYICAACLAIIFMPDRVQVVFHAILLPLMVIVYVISIQKSITLKRTLKNWMDGFNDLQSWAGYLETMPSCTISPQTQHKIETVEQEYEPSQHRIFCPFCGEPDQKLDKYCQNCGKKNSSQNGEA